MVDRPGQQGAEDARRWAPDELRRPPQPEEGTAGPPASPAASPLPSAEDRAYQRGLQEGLAAGREREVQRLSKTLAAVESAIEALADSRPAWLDNLPKNLAALAIAVAEQIVQRELASDPELIENLVASALAQFPVDEPLTVRLNPGDLARLTEVGPDGAGPGAGRDLRWRADPLVDPGGCVVEGAERLVDGRVDKALLRIYRELATDD